MPLSEIQLTILAKAIQDYDFPPVIYDFAANTRRTLKSMAEVEATIRSQLLATDIDQTKDGLSNVIYWGYARTGYGFTRVQRFRQEVETDCLLAALKVFHQNSGPGARQIAQLGLPEIKWLSFVSKVRMFLDPVNHVVLDLQLLKLRTQPTPTVFRDIHAPANATSISVTKHNEAVYDRWCRQCNQLALQYFSENRYRAVDIERGIFQLAQRQPAVAADILASA